MLTIPSGFEEAQKLAEDTKFYLMEKYLSNTSSFKTSSEASYNYEVEDWDIIDMEQKMAHEFN